MIITSDEEKELIENYRLGYRGVYWSVMDFENKANANEIEENIELYDRTKFEDALDKMVNEHDAQYGITWSTVDTYLELYCKLPDNCPKQLKLKLNT